MEKEINMLGQTGNNERKEIISDFKELPGQEVSSISSNEYGASNEERFNK